VLARQEYPQASAVSRGAARQGGRTRMISIVIVSARHAGVMDGGARRAEFR